MPVGALGELSAFRRELHQCLTRRPDALFDVVDAVLRTEGPVHHLAELSLAAQHRRGRGSLRQPT